MDEAQRQAAEQKAEEANELTMAQQQEDERAQTTIIDHSDPAHPREIPLTDDALGGVATQPDGVVVSDPGMDDGEVPQTLATMPMVTIQVYEDIQFIFGMGNNYDLAAGRNHRVPVAVADHLSEKGWVAFRAR